MNSSVGALHLFANFDSGNLQSASLRDPLDELRGVTPDGDGVSLQSPFASSRSLLGGRQSVVETRAEYYLQVAPDCQGQYDNMHRSWFYFGACLEHATPDQETLPALQAASGNGRKASMVFARHRATFTITNLSATNLIFEHDNRPVYSTDAMDGWCRLQQPLQLTYHDHRGNPVQQAQLVQKAALSLAAAVAASAPPSASVTNHADRKWKKGAYSCTQRVSWTYTFTRPGETVYFAMCYPYSYHRQLQAIEEWSKMVEERPRPVVGVAPGPHPDPSPADVRKSAPGTPTRGTAKGQGKPSNASHPGTPIATPPREPRKTVTPPPSPTAVPQASTATRSFPPQPPPSPLQHPPPPASDPSEGVYFLRETLCFTQQNRRVDLLTITGHNGKSSDGDREPYISSVHPVRSDVVRRPHQFLDKKIALVTCRVHPGETPASHVLHGLVEMLLSARDPRSCALRQHFVFVIIPMLNPDGVAAGHYRTDLRGVNLNRMYDTPDPRLHPSIFAARELFLATARTGRLVLYLDLHAHASKRGCFVFGNAWDDTSSQIEALLYPKLLSLNTPHFDFLSCDFTSRSMQQKNKAEGVSKEGTGRVALAVESGLVLSYTLEASYNMGTCLNTVAANEWDAVSFDTPSSAHTPPASATAGSSNSRRSSVSSAASSSASASASGTPPCGPTSAAATLRYTPDTYGDLGRGICVAVLDMFALNPSSRLPLTPFGSVNGVRLTLERQLKLLHQDQEHLGCAGVIAGQVHRTKLDRNKALEKTSVAYSLPMMNAYDNMSRHKLRHGGARDGEKEGSDEEAVTTPFRLRV